MPDDPHQNQPGAPPAPAGNQPPSQPAEDYRAKYEDLNKRWTETEPRLKTLEKWEKWGDPDQFERNLANNATKLIAEKRAEWEAEQRRNAPPTQPRNPFEGYELLTPEQQAQVVADQAAARAEAKALELINKRWTEATGRLNDTDQRFALLSRAMTERLQNPDLDLNKLWDAARQLATGDQNQLFELAVDRVTAPARVQKQIEQAVAAEKAKWEQEQKNRDQAALVGSGAGNSAASFKEVLAARKNEGTDSLRTRILKQMIEKGEITPAQV